MSRPAAHVVDLPLQAWQRLQRSHDWERSRRELQLDDVDWCDPDLPRSLRVLAALPPGTVARWPLLLGWLVRAEQAPEDPVAGFASLGEDELPRLLGLEAWVIWHRGRWYRNLALPLALVQDWQRRVEPARLRAGEAVEELEAGLQLLQELEQGGRHAEAGKAVADLVEELAAKRRLHQELHGLSLELTALAEDLQAEQRRRLRPPERGETHPWWERDLGPIWERVAELTDH